LKNFFDRSTNKWNKLNLFHAFLRAANFFALSWLTIIAAHYAVKAQINFGIIFAQQNYTNQIACKHFGKLQGIL
jgi:hypothetical protein